VKIFLDDERLTPEGWVRVNTVKELIDLYLMHREVIDVISLDHDLGENVPDGQTFLEWLEERVYTQPANYTPIPVLLIHSANPVGRAEMTATIRKIRYAKANAGAM